MGQYYKVINIDKREYMNPESVCKLMEWSYNKNLLVLNLVKKLANEWKGDRVYVVGDYAVSQDREKNSYDYEVLEKIEKELGFYQEKGRFSSLYGYAYENFKEVELEKIQNEEYRYIYNHNKKEYIDLEHCPVAWFYKNKNEYEIVRISPISLALALGNGMGGGDYSGNNNELVGMYINDIQDLEITKEPLNLEYNEIRPEFYESYYIPYDEIKNEIEYEESKYEIARHITKFIFKYDKENFKKYYKNQIEAEEKIGWSLDYYAQEKINTIKDIIITANDNVKEKGNKIIDEINNYMLVRNVKHALNECKQRFADGVNDKYYINEAYKRIFEKLQIKNIKSIMTEKNKTYITFETQENYEIITEKVESATDFIKNAIEIKKISQEQREVIKFFEIDNRIQKKDKLNHLYYYEYRESEGIKVIEKNVWVNYEGTLVTNKDILNGKEYIEYDEIFNNPKLLLQRDSDIADEIEQNTKNKTKEEEEEI